MDRAEAHLHRACTDWTYLSSVSGDGPIAEFEKQFLSAVGGEFALALSNCTSALFVALQAAGVGPGDEVVLPAYTWPQTLAPIVTLGATPVFADLGVQTVTVDPASVAERTSERTKAIIAVHLYGYPANVHALDDIAQETGCPLIYDAAQGFGALIDDRPIGAYGNYVAFSFGRGKLLSVGEGGALVCQDRAAYERVVAASQHPLRQHRDLDALERRRAIDGVGMNFRMHPLVASLALGQLEGLRRTGRCNALRRTFRQIQNTLARADLEHLLPNTPSNGQPNGHAVPLLPSSTDDVEHLEREVETLDLRIEPGGGLDPLHFTPTVQGGPESTNAGIEPSHPTHRRGSCPHAECRSEYPPLFVNPAPSHA